VAGADAVGPDGADSFGSPIDAQEVNTISKTRDRSGRAEY